MKVEPDLASDEYLHWLVEQSNAESIDPEDVNRPKACRILLRHVAALQKAMGPGAASPVPMRLTCPECGALHIDEGEFATKPHHTHSCQLCGLTWRPSVVATVGVRFLPGFKNGGTP